MKRKVNQIKDLALIEKELNKTKVGILAYSDDKEKVSQVITTFVYTDKNIYIIFENHEDYDRINVPSNVSFSIYKEEKVSKENILDFEPIYKFLQIKCNGSIKKVDEPKIAQEVLKAYRHKYTFNPEKGKDDLEKLFFVDTEELQGAEMFGG